MQTGKLRSAAAGLLAACMLAGCGAEVAEQPDVPTTQAAQTEPALLPDTQGQTLIDLSDDGVRVQGDAEALQQDAVYTDHDIVYYEDRDSYESGNPYGEGSASDRHSAEEAANHLVVHITRPGTYRISGTLHAGQIAVDLGKEAKTDPEAKVTLILDNADITCTVAPAIIFYNVFECDTAWVAADDDDSLTYTANPVQDTSNAGANIILADGSVNNISGSYVARIYKDNDQQKKLHKYDGAVYSKMSMNVSGEAQDTGVLNIDAANEGLDTELHLTINGGVINIRSDNDGINTNEDGVSVTTINGGQLHIVAGLGAEGDGVDSNGYLVINGGTVISAANPASDSGLDSDMGSIINGGWVLALGSTMDWAESDSGQVTMNLQFASRRDAGDAIIITDLEGNVAFAYDPNMDTAAGSDIRGYQGAVISCPNLQVGESYYVYAGGDMLGQSVNGLYVPATVTEFFSTRQTYTGTDVGGFGRGMRGDFGGMDGQRPELPEGGMSGGRPEGDMPMGERPERPEGEMMPVDGQFPEGQEPGMRPEGMPGENFGGKDFAPGGFDPGAQMGDLPARDVFTLADKVNAFSGIADEK